MHYTNDKHDEKAQAASFFETLVKITSLWRQKNYNQEYPEVFQKDWCREMG